MKSRLSCVVSETGPLAGLALLAVAFACQVPESRPDDADSPAIEPGSGPGIVWQTGTVEAAFETAQEAGKPIFLYWGAEWCPPCQQLKSTVFRQPEFIERTELFVSV